MSSYHHCLSCSRLVERTRPFCSLCISKIINVFGRQL